MIKLAFDENLDARISKGLRRRLEDLDATTVQEAGLTAAPDPEVLAWAAREDRVLVSHDVSTLPAHAYARIDRGEHLPGVVMVPNDLEIGHAIEDLLTLLRVATTSDLMDQVTFLPL